MNTVKIYDGPGALSHEIVGTNAVTLSSYQAYIRYYTKAQYSIISEYQIATKHSLVRSSHLNWTSIYRFGDTRDCVHYKDIETHFKSKSGQCWPKHYISHYSVHQMEFDGFNMLLHSPYAYSTTCEYGGLFIFEQDKSGDLTDVRIMCSNTTTEIILPYEQKPGYRMVIIFVTFPGYSSGFVDLIITKEKNCIGPNHEFMYPNMESPHKLGDEMNHYTDAPQSTQCTDIWLTVNLRLQEWFIFTELKYIQSKYTERIMGSFDMITSAYLVSLTTYHTHLNAMSNIYIDFIALHYKDYPFDLATDIIHIIIPHWQISKHSFEPSVNMGFYVNYSGHDYYPALALRIQFLQNLTCTSLLYNGFPKITSPIHKLSKVSDVYVSEYFAYNKILLNVLGYWGRHMGSCRLLVLGQECFSQQLHYDVIRLHYDPSILDTAYDVGVSMEKTPNCSTHCSLDIGIWEVIVPSQKMRYHEWRNVYLVTWQVAAALDIAIILQINSTCYGAPCNKRLCNTAIAIHTPQPWIVSRNWTLMITFIFIFTLALGLINRNMHYRPLLIHSIYHFCYDSYTMRLDFRSISKQPEPASSSWDNPINQEPYLFYRLIYGFAVASQSLTITISDPVYGNWYDVHAFCAAKNASLVTWKPTLAYQLKQLYFESADQGWNSLQGRFFAGLHREHLVGINRL